MIYKKGNVKDPANYRPIALICCLVKIFTQILSNRLVDWAEMSNLFPEWQAGFRRGRSCLDNTFTLNALIQNRLNQTGGKLYVLFVDFKSAFLSLNHRILWQKLYNMGCRSKFINILKDLYSKANFSVKCEKGFTKRINITQGVLQGEVLSPALFTFFLEDLERFLISRGIRGVSLDHKTEILLISYADDIALCADSPVLMLKILKCLYEYCQLNDLELNVNKTKIVIFNKRGHLQPGRQKHKFTYGNNIIEIVKKYTYLGTIFNNSAIFKDNLNCQLAKSALARDSILTMIYKTQIDSWCHIVQLFQSMVTSVALYSVKVWGIRYFNDLEKIQNTFYK